MIRSPAIVVALWSLVALICCFLVLPSLIVIPMSFNSDDLVRFPPLGFSWRWYEAFFNREDWTQPTIASFIVGTTTTIFATVLGVLTAYGLIRGKVPARSVVIIILLLPMIVPTMVTALALYNVFAPINLVGTIAGMVLAHTVIAFPFVFINAAASLQRMDWRMEQAARSLGASPITAFFHVTLPMIKAGVVAGAVFAFITSFDEVVVSRFISGTSLVTLPVKMWNGLRFELNPIIASVSSMLIVLSVLGLGGMLIVRTNRLRPNE